MLGNLVVLRRRLAAIGRPLLPYVPSLVVQVGQIAIYPIYSALFEAADADAKIALILFFLLLKTKMALKKIIFRLTRTSSHELSSEIATSGVEIRSSMYQSMITQSTPSPLATALVTGLDVVQGLVDSRRFMYQLPVRRCRRPAGLVRHRDTSFLQHSRPTQAAAVARCGSHTPNKSLSKWLRTRSWRVFRDGVRYCCFFILTSERPAPLSTLLAHLYHGLSNSVRVFNTMMKKMSTAVVPSAATAPSPPTSAKEPTPAWPPIGATPPRASPRCASVRNRFSLAKMTRLVDYCRTTSTLRQLTVVSLFTVPSALTSLLSCLVSLRAPSPSLAENKGFWVHFLVTFLLSYGGTVAQVRAAASIPHALYTNMDIALVAGASTALLTGLAFLVATHWRFPIPFTWVLIMTPWLLCLALGNALVLRSRLRALARPLLAYAPSLTVQVSQIALYPAYSALFEAAYAHQKIALILFFPVLKWALKKSIFALTRSSNHELSSEIAASGVEICASMYQSMIMQSTPSTLATALVIGLDVVHGLVDVRRFLTLRHDRQDNDTDVLAVLQRAVDAQGTAAAGVQDERELARFGTRSDAAALLSMWGSRRHASLVAVAPAVREDDKHKLALTQALEMLQAAETILLVEYIEVAVPLVNAVYLCVATQFESALFNPRLRCFYGNLHELRAAVGSVVLYTALQTLTLGAMAVAVQRRLQLSALTLLAFVLERHFWSLQGKLISWMCVLFVFSVIHYGVDFSFQFDFTATVSEPSC